MGGPRLFADSGPLVAFLNRGDQFHEWASREFDLMQEPLITCEAVISEVVFLLQSDGLKAEPLFEAIRRRHILVEFAAREHWPDLQTLIRKYSDLPMSFADACLVRLSELADDCQVITTDRHFRIYRRRGRQLIPLRSPF